MFKKGSDGKLSINLVVDDTVTDNHNEQRFTIKPTSLLAGDLAFLAVMMGKEGFSSAWCNWCKLPKSAWQCADCKPDLWTIDEIRQQVDLIAASGWTDTRCLGVRRSPECEIAFSNILFSGLHAQMGIVQQILDRLDAFVDLRIENISHEEMQVRREKTNSAIDLERARAEKAIWMESHEGGKALNKKRRRVKRLQLLMSQETNEGTLSLHAIEKEKLEEEVVKLVEKRNAHTTRIKSLEKGEGAAKEKLDEYTRARHGAEESTYTQIDR